MKTDLRYRSFDMSADFSNNDRIVRLARWIIHDFLKCISFLDYTNRPNRSAERNEFIILIDFRAKLSILFGKYEKYQDFTPYYRIFDRVKSRISTVNADWSILLGRPNWYCTTYTVAMFHWNYLIL